jgi:hypothetical protein
MAKAARVPVSAQRDVQSPDLDQLDNVAGTAQGKTAIAIEIADLARTIASWQPHPL